ncbi:uncharacterized protein DDB_G0292186-like [Musca vetustissima]|uniref:uncharacterized protein DDB_G0292186-like n=1 Tax=Musca vetustissima TaxID=27455 RepID=UPI002AB7D99A|nr:uncharacterized protein DDB_G0292186-like [Musca vetustissima]
MGDYATRITITPLTTTTNNTPKANSLRFVRPGRRPRRKPQNNSFQCKICQRFFCSKSGLRRHEKVHAAPALQCCSEVTVSATNEKSNMNLLQNIYNRMYPSNRGESARTRTTTSGGDTNGDSNNPNSMWIPMVEINVENENNDNNNNQNQLSKEINNNNHLEISNNSNVANNFAAIQNPNNSNNNQEIQIPNNSIIPIQNDFITPNNNAIINPLNPIPNNTNMPNSNSLIELPNNSNISNTNEQYQILASHILTVDSILPPSTMPLNTDPLALPSPPIEEPLSDIFIIDEFIDELEDISNLSADFKYNIRKKTSSIGGGGGGVGMATTSTPSASLSITLLQAVTKQEEEEQDNNIIDDSQIKVESDSSTMDTDLFPNFSTENSQSSEAMNFRASMEPQQQQSITPTTSGGSTAATSAVNNTALIALQQLASISSTHSIERLLPQLPKDLLAHNETLVYAGRTGKRLPRQSSKRLPQFETNRCPLCSRVYRSQAFLNEHMRKEHSVLI